jgi:hypothetical protein
LSLALSGLTDAAAKAQGNEDLDLLRRVGGAMEEIRDAVARTPKGQKIALERWNAAGVPEKIEGTAAGSEPGRLLVRTDVGILPLEIGELTPGAIADAFSARPAKKPGDERTVALLALLGGDSERAAKLKVELPERWSKFAGKAAAAVMAGREADARRLFVEAEDAAGDPLRIATTLTNYKSLLADYPTTALVVRNRALLAGRPNLGKEYLFLPDTLRGSGSFILAKAGKMESAWLSERDSDAAALAQNYVELGFTALADLDYRLWIYAGGCCLETFSFGVQGTDMVLPTARTTAAEPGGAASIPIRPPLSLKKTHAAHTGPKSPARWDWIAVPLPKYSSPGVKVVRILTEQQGFAVAYASVSALTSNSPRESELRELEKSRPRRPQLTEKDIPGLLAHWRLDEGRGGTVNDAVGKIGAGSIQRATWTSGRSGWGLHFDGDNSYVELPNPPELDRIAEGNYSLMAWFKPDDVPAGRDEQNSSGYAIALKPGHHIGLYYGAGGSFAFMNWLGKNEDPDHWALVHVSTRAFPPGLFYHVAGSFNRTAGRSQIYVNGRLEQSQNVDPGSPSVSNINASWKLGIGGPGYPKWRWCAKGVIDEVRFYNRALSTVEIEALYRMAAPSPSPAARTPADARPWKPVFDGKSMGWINPASQNAWQVKDGCIANVPGVDNAAQTSEEFGDGDLRIRLESRSNSSLWFNFRQSGPVYYGVNLRQALGEAANQGEHELIFSCRGSVQSATVDGKPVRVDTTGTPSAKGVVQFNCSVDGSLRIRSIEFREPK